MHRHTDISPEAWSTYDTRPEPFDDLIEEIADACLECAAQGWQEPLPGMRLVR